jgi:pyruvate dehydrogenase E2 component (dihydrolipoamide acetyltransferase)
MKVFALPDLGEGLHEAEIVEWRIAVGEVVAADQTMLAVETDKAIVEVPAPYAGTVAKLFAGAGERVQVGAPLVGFEGEAADAGAIVGELRGEGESPGSPAPPPGPARARAAPAVRARARALGVDLARVAASGPGGAITSEDVERAAAGARQAGTPEPLRGVRRAMARHMARAQAEVAAATVMDDADIEAWPEGTSILPRLARALVAGCRAEPGLNAWYDRRAEARTLFASVHLGIAVDTPGGLIVPVLRDCEKLDPQALRMALERLIASARERKTPPGDLRGHTITLSNYGAIAGRYAAPIVVPPTVAILGAGRIERRVAAAEGRPDVRRTLPLSLTFDHRVVSGGEAGRFLLAVIADLERPA